MQIAQADIKSPEVSREVVNAALEAVICSDVFQGSLRLQEFLRYVVERSLDQHGGRIPAKLIAEDVYRRAPGAGAESDNVVRVDAGRLRRRLEQYYATTGQNDPIIIHIDSGGYSPRFEIRELPEIVDAGRSRQSQKYQRLGLAAAVVAGLAIVGGVGYNVSFGSGSSHFKVEIDEVTHYAPVSEDGRILERQALLESSAAALQAVNLAEQARDMIFPIPEIERVKLVADMFHLATKKDETYYGGYAGRAQCLAAIALFSPPGKQRQTLLAEAAMMADKAMDLDPTKSWSQAAAAWVAYVDGDYETATRMSKRALSISPDDGHILGFHSVISLNTGDFEGALRAADPSRLTRDDSDRLVTRNIYGAASFHVGEYEQAILAFNTASGKGAPVSVLSIAYLAASYQSLGNTSEALRYVQFLSETWPNFPAHIVFRQLFQDPKHANNIIVRLTEGGGTPPTMNLAEK